MSPSAATIAVAVGVLGLLYLDRDRESRVSPALWIPVVWISIAGSRMVSVWLQVAPEASTDQYLEGSPFDRLILTSLLAAGVLVLCARGSRVTALLGRNGPVLVFFVYCGVSVMWSDYPDVAFKRWTKLVGDMVMVMVTLTDRDPSAAISKVLARTAFLLIPGSVLLIKYYPDLGRGYNPWTWTSFYTGVATGKNGLGYVCLVFGLASCWRLLGTFGSPARSIPAGLPAAARTESTRAKAGPRIAHAVIVAMTLWLFWKANSATSLACFLIGVMILLATRLPGIERKPTLVPLTAGTLLFLSLSALFLDAGGSLVQAMGRDTTLTGRTALWDLVLRMAVDPLFGTGFESFWLGERVEQIWRIHWWHPNQAHNGYLELYLNLGAIGVGLLMVMLVSGYRNATRMLRRDPHAGGLRLAYLIAAIVYNLTEAAFKMMHPVWIACLFAVTAVGDDRVRDHE